MASEIVKKIKIACGKQGVPEPELSSELWKMIQVGIRGMYSSELPYLNKDKCFPVEYIYGR